MVSGYGAFQQSIVPGKTLLELSKGESEYDIRMPYDPPGKNALLAGVSCIEL